MDGHLNVFVHVGFFIAVAVSGKVMLTHVTRQTASRGRGRSLGIHAENVIATLRTVEMDRRIELQREGRWKKRLQGTSMPATRRCKQDKDLEQHKKETLQALIEEQVIHRLGKPVGVRNVQVRRPWENRYRVNVLIGENAVSATIGNSYFVKADSDGNIVDSNPEMTKLCPIR